MRLSLPAGPAAGVCDLRRKSDRGPSLVAVLRFGLFVLAFSRLWRILIANKPSSFSTLSSAILLLRSSSSEDIRARGQSSEGIFAQGGASRPPGDASVKLSHTSRRCEVSGPVGTAVIVDNDPKRHWRRDGQPTACPRPRDDPVTI